MSGLCKIQTVESRLPVKHAGVTSMNRYRIIPLKLNSLFVAITALIMLSACATKSNPDTDQNANQAPIGIATNVEGSSNVQSNAAASNINESGNASGSSNNSGSTSNSQISSVTPVQTAEPIADTVKNVKQTESSTAGSQVAQSVTPIPPVTPIPSTQRLAIPNRPTANGPVASTPSTNTSASTDIAAVSYTHLTLPTIYSV